MATMRELFEVLEEGDLDEGVWQKVKELFRGKKKQKRKTVSKRVGPDKWEFQGKTGHWRTVNGNELFFPDDDSKPMGMPKEMARASASGSEHAMRGRR